MQKPRIAICITHFEPGGQSVVIEEQTKRLASEFEFTLFTEKLVKQCPPWMKCIEVKPWKYKYIPIKNNKFVETLRKFDIIHCHDSLHFMDVTIKTGKPVIVTSHGICPPKYREGLIKKFDGYLTQILYPKYYRQAGRVIAISNYIKEWLINEMKVDPKKVVLIYNGIDHETFKPLPKDKWLPYRKGDPMLIYTGEISKRKGIDILLRAFAEVKKEYKNAKLVLTGHGNIELLRKLRKRLGLGNSVEYLGIVPKKELALLYNAADLYVTASYWEGFGLPLIEAMACGTPVVARNAYTMREHLLRSSAGEVFELNENLSKAILKVLEYGKEIYFHNAIAYSKRFDWHLSSTMLGEVYEEYI